MVEVKIRVRGEREAVLDFKARLSSFVYIMRVFVFITLYFFGCFE